MAITSSQPEKNKPEHVLSPSTSSVTPLSDARMLAASRMNRINSLWEYTQAVLAITLTMATIFAATISSRHESETLKNALFVVLGFYFGRTNHSRPTPTDPTGIQNFSDPN